MTSDKFNTNKSNKVIIVSVHVSDDRPGSSGLTPVCVCDTVTLVPVDPGLCPMYLVSVAILSQPGGSRCQNIGVGRAGRGQVQHLVSYTNIYRVSTKLKIEGAAQYQDHRTQVLN